jgi:hypothetical protein
VHGTIGGLPASEPVLSDAASEPPLSDAKPFDGWMPLFPPELQAIGENAAQGTTMMQANAVTTRAAWDILTRSVREACYLALAS